MIGVIGIQGAVSEHIAMMEQVFSKESINGHVNVIKPSDSLNDIDGIILPGGESTTISRVLRSSGLFDEIKKRASQRSLAVMGTCAGCILVASELVDDNVDVELLQLMSIRVHRNAYGRQKDSFEQLLDISMLDLDEPSLFPAVFIRAPIIDTIGEEAHALAFDSNKKPVMVKQDNVLALTFHPELTDDSRIHSYFLSMVKDMKEKR